MACGDLRSGHHRGPLVRHPADLSVLIPGGQFFIVIRILRLLRIFRVFKRVRFLVEARLLAAALKASKRKIMVFLFTVLMLSIVFNPGGDNLYCREN